MNFTATLQSSGKGAEPILSSLRSLEKSSVYVGIPEKSTSRQGGAITNAQLAFIHTHGVRNAGMRHAVGIGMRRGLSYGAATQLYLHTHGSRLMQVPPRPIIEPAIEDRDNRRLIEPELKAAAQAALDGKKQQVYQYLARAGIAGQNAVRGWFTNPRNGWAPNAPSTIRRKGSSRPLIDTGQLRNSITYVVSKA